MLRKFEKQAMRQAAKEAKRQQGKQQLSLKTHFQNIGYIFIYRNISFAIFSNNGCRGEAEEEGGAKIS